MIRNYMMMIISQQVQLNPIPSHLILKNKINNKKKKNLPRQL